MRDAGLATGRGADARLHERGGAAAARGRPGRSTSTAAPAARSGTRAQTSGNRQRVRQIRFDCDGDALVALVEPAGPACHTGQRSCFYRDLDGSADPTPEAPPAEGEPAPGRARGAGILERTMLDRQRARPAGSYTVELLDDPPRIGDKVREEAEEVARAAASESDERLSPRRRRTSSTTFRCCWSRAGSRSRRRWRRSMAVAAEADAWTSNRAWSRPESWHARATRSPCAMSFVDDCETPVSAFLKLRDGGPCFLLESAEQGRLGRYSFLGFSPRAVLRWSDGVLERVARRAAGRRTRAAARRPGSLRGRQRVPGEIPAPAGRRPAAVRRRRGRASSATTWCAPSSRWASRTRTRSGFPTWR